MQPPTANYQNEKSDHFYFHLVKSILKFLWTLIHGLFRSVFFTLHLSGDFSLLFLLLLV